MNKSVNDAMNTTLNTPLIELKAANNHWEYKQLTALNINWQHWVKLEVKFRVWQLRFCFKTVMLILIFSWTIVLLLTWIVKTSTCSYNVNMLLNKQWSQLVVLNDRAMLSMCACVHNWPIILICQRVTLIVIVYRLKQSN